MNHNDVSGVLLLGDSSVNKAENAFLWDYDSGGKRRSIK